MSDQKQQLAEIGERLRTQDNRIRADPIFIVEEAEKVWGVGDDYADGFAWLNENDPEQHASDLEAAGLEAKRRQGEDTAPWHRVGYVERWRFVTACFTEKGCQSFIECNGHNLRQPRIYAASGYRNAEWQLLRQTLMAKAVK